jgi:hypothetical protein
LEEKKLEGPLKEERVRDFYTKGRYPLPILPIPFSKNYSKTLLQSMRLKRIATVSWRSL